MKKKARILSGALLLLSFRFFAQPPAPGDADPPNYSIDKGITLLLIAGFVYGIFLIRKRIKVSHKEHRINLLKKYTKSLKNESAQKTIVNHHSK